ncbi:hypothetical protein ACFX1X_028178 [Malus domestica]
MVSAPHSIPPSKSETQNTPHNQQVLIPFGSSSLSDWRPRVRVLRAQGSSPSCNNGQVQKPKQKLQPSSAQSDSALQTQAALYHSLTAGHSHAHRKVRSHGHSLEACRIRQSKLYHHLLNHAHNENSSDLSEDDQGPP